MPTIGTAITKITLPNEKELQHKFHLVENNLPIPTDGILGRDFLCKYACTIDYDTWMLTGRSDFETFELPIHDEFKGKIFLPPRSEVYRRINIGNNQSTYLVRANEIEPGVFIANSIVDSHNPVLKFLNTTSKIVEIKQNFSYNLSNIENYEIYTFNSN